MASLVDLYTAAVSLLGAVGLVYLLYSGRYAVSYRRFFRLVVVGLLMAVLGGPLLFFIPHAYRHAIHGLATLSITLGMYDLLRGRLRVGRPGEWTELYIDDVRAADRAPGDD